MITNILRALWGSADTATEHRNRGVVRALASIYGVKVVTVAANLVMVPLASSYLGLERYGLWLAVSSVIGLLALSDFGLGSNLTTLLAHSIGRSDTAAASRQVSATVWAVALAAFVLAVVFFALHSVIDWARLFNAAGARASSEAPHAAWLVGLIAALQLLSGLCYRLYAGMQRAYWGSVWQGGGVVAGFVALVAVVQFRGGLFSLVFAMGMVPVLVQLAGLVWILWRGDFGLFVFPTKLRRADFRLVLRGGALMSIVNLQAVFWLSKDSLMIAHALGLDVVGSYNTAFRILQSVFLLVVGSLGASLWPAYADAFARGDDGWIRRNLRRSLIGATGTMFGFAICFVPFGEQLLTWYAGRGMALPTSELAWMGVYFVTLTVVNVLSFPLMGIGKLGIIAWGGLIGGALSLPIGVLALHRYGISGLIITNLTCVVFAILAPLIWKIHELRLAWRDGRHDNRFRND